MSALADFVVGAFVGSVLTWLAVVLFAAASRTGADLSDSEIDAPFRAIEDEGRGGRP